VFEALIGNQSDGGVSLRPPQFPKRHAAFERDEMSAFEVTVEIGGRINEMVVEDLHGT